MLNVKQVSLVLHVCSLANHILATVLNVWGTCRRWFLVQQYLRPECIGTSGATADRDLFFSLAVVVIVDDGFHD